jgi:hypothetical protein
MDSTVPVKAAREKTVIDIHSQQRDANNSYRIPEYRDRQDAQHCEDPCPTRLKQYAANHCTSDEQRHTRTYATTLWSNFNIYTGQR